MPPAQHIISGIHITAQELANKLSAIEGVEVQTMVFRHPS